MQYFTFTVIDEEASARTRSAYIPEITCAGIMSIIQDSMEDEGITREDIPEEKKFTSPAKAKHSKRYFEVKGFAWFSCPRRDNRWPSVNSRCIIDLKRQTICYRYSQDCRKCESSADPEFPVESIEKMAEFAVRQCRIKTGYLYNHETTDTGETPHEE